MQLGLTVGLLLLGVAKVRPDLTAKFPVGGMTEESGTPDGRRMQRPWWLTPTLMTLSVIVTFYVIAALVMTGGGSSWQRPRLPIQTMAWVGAWPVYVGLFLGFLGFLGGHRFNSAARDTIDGQFKIVWLPDAHPIAKRVHDMAGRIDLPPPQVGVTNVVNAFAMGASVKNAAVVLGLPLLKQMPQEEVDAIIGHELGHIVSGDMRRMQYAEGFQRMFGTLFYTIGMTLTSALASNAKSGVGRETGKMFGHLFSLVGRALVNLGGELMVKSLSRSREFHADAIGATLTSKAAMQGALARLPTVLGDTSPAEEEFAYLMFRPSIFRWLFSTHPSMEKRIAALESGSHMRRIPRRIKSAITP